MIKVSPKDVIELFVRSKLYFIVRHELVRRSQSRIWDTLFAIFEFHVEERG